MPKCPSNLNLTLYTERSLPDSEAAVVREHVLDCPLCGETVENLMLLQSMEHAGELAPVEADKAARAVDVLRGLARPPENKPAAWLQRFFNGAVGPMSVLQALECMPAIAEEVRVVLKKGDTSRIVENLCALRCEYLVLQECGVEVDEETLLREAIEHNWLDPCHGTPLDCLGRLLELHGLRVERQFHADMAAVRKALKSGHRTILAVDRDELHPGNALAALWEILEDCLIPDPNHCLMVVGTETQADGRESVVVLDPVDPTQHATLPLDVFLDAWADSENYLLVAYKDPA